MTTNTEEKEPKKTSAERAQEQIVRAAGDVLLHSKLPTLARAGIAAKMTDLAMEFGKLADQAFGGAE
jgi:hypothetical protein